MGCSPIKAVRELGLERRETVDKRAVYKLGYLLETPEYPALLTVAPPRLIQPTSTVGVVERGGSDNATGAVNQQERLDESGPESSETICQAPPLPEVKRWSDLHGDMQSQAEMPWPPAPCAGGNNNVGPYPVQP